MSKPTLLTRARAAWGALKGINFGGYGGGYGWNDPWGGVLRSLPGASYDYRREAGITWENSIVATAINWAINNWAAAPLVVEEKQGTQWVIIEDHPAYALFDNPNPYYGPDELWGAALLSMMVAGNGYFYIDQSYLMEPTGLYYMPHFNVSPRWPATGNVFISGYEYRTGDGKFETFRVDEVVHFRHGLDPINQRMGLSPITSVLREICADNEAATAAAALMRNFGIPGLSFVPAEGVEMTSENIAKFRTLGQQKLTGERRGELLIPSVPGKFDTLGFSPNELAMDVIRKVPEERICSVLGISPIVLQLGAGMDGATYSNYATAQKASYSTFLVPMWRRMAAQLTKQLLPLYYNPTGRTLRFSFDASKATALHENAVDKANAARSNYEAEIWTRNEARTETGLDPIEGGDVFRNNTREGTQENEDIQP